MSFSDAGRAKLHGAWWSEPFKAFLSHSGTKRDSSTMSTMFADTILIVFISICTALLAEGGWKSSIQQQAHLFINLY